PALDHQGAQSDASVHVTGEVDVADGPGVGPALRRLDLIDDLHGPDLGCPGDGTGREPGAEGVEGGHPGLQLAADVRGDVHDVRVPLDLHHVGNLDAVVLGDPADVVASQVHEHDVLGTLLGIGQQLRGQGLVFGVVNAPPPRAGEGTDGDNAVLDAHEDLG